MPGADKGFDPAGRAEIRAFGNRRPLDRARGPCRPDPNRDGIEKALCRAGTVGRMAPADYRGIKRLRRFTLAMAASNLARLPRLPAARR